MIIFFRNGEMSLTLELLRMETDRDLFWPYSAGNALISAVPHDCPKAAKKAANNNSSNQTLVNNNNNNNSLSKVRAGLSTHKRHSYCKYFIFSAQWPECNFFRIGIFYIFLCVWHLMYFIYYFLPKVFSYVWHIQSNIFVLPSYAYVYYLCHVKFLIFCEKKKKKTLKIHAST